MLPHTKASALPQSANLEIAMERDGYTIEFANPTRALLMPAIGQTTTQAGFAARGKSFRRTNSTSTKWGYSTPDYACRSTS